MKKVCKTKQNISLPIPSCTWHWKKLKSYSSLDATSNFKLLLSVLKAPGEYLVKFFVSLKISWVYWQLEHFMDRVCGRYKCFYPSSHCLTSYLCIDWGACHLGIWTSRDHKSFMMCVTLNKIWVLQYHLKRDLIWSCEEHFFLVCLSANEQN